MMWIAPPSPSPDGTRFVYVRWTPDHKDQFSEMHIADKDGGNDQLIYTSMNQLQAPVWSPQGNQIAWIEVNGPTAAVITILRHYIKEDDRHCLTEGHHLRRQLRGLRRPGMAAR